jgi:DNA-binding MarR family transcriptional regulator
MAFRDSACLQPPRGPSDLRNWIKRILAAGAIARAGRRQIAAQAAGATLTDQEFLVLWLCEESPSCRGQGELAELLGVSAAQMSNLVERLRRRELLQFERHITDRRRQVWQLTDAGKTLLLTVCSLLAAQTTANNSTPGQGGPSSCAA